MTAAQTSCPKCHAVVEPGVRECRRCGIVLSKYRARVAEEAAPPRELADNMPGADAGRDPVWWGRAALVMALAWWTWGFARAPFGEAMMDTVWHLPDLVFHEAGHILFMPFGPFMTSLGGSLFQCSLPAALALVFIRQDNRFGAFVCLWWAGQNLVDVAPYIADARSLRLVLLGGRTGAEVEGHDWELILTQLGWLHHDHSLGLWAYRVGMLMMMSAVVAAVWQVCQVQNRQDQQFKALDQWLKANRD